MPELLKKGYKYNNINLMYDFSKGDHMGDNFCFVIREFTIKESIRGNIYDREVVGFGLHDLQKDIIYPLPLTKFLEYYRNKNYSINSQKNAAEAIKRFLNFCREQAYQGVSEFLDLKSNGIKGLKLKHGSMYITHLSLRCIYEGLSADYVKSDIKYLNKFYSFLGSEGLIDEVFEQKYKELYHQKINGGKKERIKVYKEVDIFESEDTIYPPNRQKKQSLSLKDFGKDRYLLVKEFLETAESVEPDIVIGLYFQFFGGLRKGEVVNLTIDSLVETDEGYILDVDDRRSILFPSKKNWDHEQVKTPRYQGLLWHPQFEYVVHKHLNWLKHIKEKNVGVHKKALLINSRTLKPINGSNYIDKFNKVKKMYLKGLSEKGRVEHYNYLSQKEWSTHVARGCFTNFCLDVGMKVGEVAVARGDSNINSIMDYLEEKVAVQTMRNAMNYIQEAFENSELYNKDATKLKSDVNQSVSEEIGRKLQNA